MSGGRREDRADDGGSLLSRGAVGRLGGILYLGSGGFVIASLPLPQPAGADRSALFALACAALAMGALSLIAPWVRWRRTASLWLVPPAFALIATANVVGGFPYFSYGVFFVVVFVWIGISHRPAVTIVFAPLATIAYVVPVMVLGRQVAAGLSSAASVIPVCVLVGESLAWLAGRFATSREELQESYQRYSTLVELSPDAIFVHADGRFVFANPAAVRLLGATHPDEVIGRSIVDVVGLDSQESVADRVPPELEEDPTVPLIDERFVRLDEKVIDVEVADVEITYEGHAARQVVARDVTEAKRTRRALEESLEALRKVDGERRRLLQGWVSAAEEERQRIAADIHDDTIQVMSAAAMRLSVLEAKPLSPRDREIFDGTTEAVLNAIERLRHLIFELGPEILAREGLGPAIGAYLAQDALAAPLQVRLTNQLTHEPPDEIGLIAYRVAQEALSNVRKHAKATIVDVVLESKHEGLNVQIRDDGTGFSATPTMESPPGHLGLTSMRERVQMAGGWLTITSDPGAGTALEYWLPIRPPQPAAFRDRIGVAS